MQQPLTPHDFETFERIALTRRHRPLALDPHPRAAPPHTGKAAGLASWSEWPARRLHTEAGRTIRIWVVAGAPTPNPARIARREA